MKKNSIIIVTVAVIAGLLIIVWPESDQDSKAVGDPVAGQPEVVVSKVRDESVRDSGELESVLSGAELGLKPISDFKIEQHPATEAAEYYRRYSTPSSNIEILTPDGRLIYTADKDNPFVGIKAIDDGEHVAINRGDGRYRLVNTNTLKSLDLPSAPNVKRPIGFTWEWLDAKTLIGTAGIGYAETAQPKGRCCDQHVVASSLLYVYSIEDSALEVVNLPSSIKGLVFNVGRITKDGHVEVVSASGHEDDGESLGWFKLAPE